MFFFKEGIYYDKTACAFSELVSFSSYKTRRQQLNGEKWDVGYFCTSGWAVFVMLFSGHPNSLTPGQFNVNSFVDVILSPAFLLRTWLIIARLSDHFVITSWIKHLIIFTAVYVWYNYSIFWVRKCLLSACFDTRLTGSISSVPWMQIRSTK